MIVDEDEDEDEEDEEDDTDVEVNAPLTVTMAVLGFYIFFGALLFSTMAGWDWMASAYYSFITLSTIGIRYHVEA